jgi:hypothetical protein
VSASSNSSEIFLEVIQCAVRQPSIRMPICARGLSRGYSMHGPSASSNSSEVFLEPIKCGVRQRGIRIAIRGRGLSRSYLIRGP